MVLLFASLGHAKHRGIRQRLGLSTHSASASSSGEPSVMEDALLELYRTGKVTAADVGTCAKASGCKGIRRLWKGAAKKTRTRKGKVVANTKNCSRNLRRALNKRCTLPPCYMASVPLWDPLRDCKTTGKVSFLPPHDTLSAMVERIGVDAFCSLSSAGQGGLSQVLRDFGQRLSIDVASTPTACLALWGDSAPYVKKDSLYLLLFTCISGTVRKRYWVCALPKRRLCRCGCFGRCTFDALFRVLGWSFAALLCGVFPSVDHEGSPFAKGTYRCARAGQPLGIRGACVAKCGDWAWHKQVLGLQGWRGEGPSRRICWLCGAGFNDHCNCFDFSTGAAWRSAMVTMDRFWAQCSAETVYVSAIWSIPGFHISYCRPDWMHSCCLGILQYLNGNCVQEMFEEVGGRYGSPGSACAKLENIMRVMSKSLGVDPPFHSLTLGMFRRASEPKPKLRLKATEGRRFLPVLREMLANAFKLDTPRAKVRLHCVEALLRCYRELDQWQDGGVSCHRLLTSARQHLLLYVELNKGSAPHMWQLYPKHHQFIHVVESTRCNPKLEWNYSDEDEIGRAAKQAAVSNTLFVETALLERYRSALDH
jgi:hypothetical protein